MFKLFKKTVFLENQRIVRELCLVDLFASTDPRLANAGIEWLGIKDNPVVVVSLFNEGGEFFVRLVDVVVKYFPFNAQPLIFFREKYLIQRWNVFQQVGVCAYREKQR